MTFNIIIRHISIIFFYAVCLEWQHQLHKTNKVRKDFGSGGHVLIFAWGHITRFFNIFLICWFFGIWKEMPYCNASNKRPGRLLNVSTIRGKGSKKCQLVVNIISLIKITFHGYKVYKGNLYSLWSSSLTIFRHLFEALL